MNTSAKWLLGLVLVPTALFGYAQISQAGWEVGELRRTASGSTPAAGRTPGRC